MKVGVHYTYGPGSKKVEIFGRADRLSGKLNPKERIAVLGVEKREVVSSKKRSMGNQGIMAQGRDCREF